MIVYLEGMQRLESWLHKQKVCQGLFHNGGGGHHHQLEKSSQSSTPRDS